LAHNVFLESRPIIINWPIYNAHSAASYPAHSVLFISRIPSSRRSKPTELAVAAASHVGECLGGLAPTSAFLLLRARNPSLQFVPLLIGDVWSDRFPPFRSSSTTGAPWWPWWAGAASRSPATGGSACSCRPSGPISRGCSRSTTSSTSASRASPPTPRRCGFHGVSVVLTSSLDWRRLAHEMGLYFFRACV
jgi:hypothetical protein